jgi:hypothetical protein
MRHPTEGVLRRLLDEPGGVAETDRQHVAGCSQCLGGLSAMRQDAALVEASLAADAAEGVDVAAAWRRLATAAPAAGPRRAAAPRRAGRLKEVLRRPAAAVLAVALILGGAGTAAANDWLQIFRTERVTPVGFSTEDLVALPDLGAYGDLALTGKPDVHEVPDAAAAEAETGLDVPEVAELPLGISGRPVYTVGSRASATFTFSVEQAAQAAASAGTQPPPAPPGLDGSQVRLDAGPGVAQVWRSSAGAPALVVGRAVAPTAFSSGVPFEAVRDYLLSLPGLPEEIAAQLRTFAGDGSTLPLPVPADQAITSSALVDGVPATVLATRDRSLAAVVWVDDGVVTVVAGALNTGSVLTVARSLR